MRAIVTFVLMAALIWPHWGGARGQEAGHEALEGTATPPRRVISANLCADQLLLALGDPESVVALSTLASDPALSPIVEEARRFPATRGSGEEIVRFSADLALIGAYDAPYTRALLAEKGVPTFALAPWSSLEEGRAQIRALAARLGHPERGEALIARIDAAAARAKGAAGRPASFLILHRRGYAPGARSVTSEIARIAGMVDLAPALGVADGGFVSLEAVIAARPDYLIVSDLDARAPDRGKELLAHPALAALYPPERRLVSPDPMTLCAGPVTPAAIDALAAEIRAKTR
jgi:iron complex transport system substrate-binding protein